MRLLYCVGSVGFTTPSTVPVKVTALAEASTFLTQSTRPLVGVGNVILTAPPVASTSTVSSVASTLYGESANTFVTTWCVTLLPFRAVRLTPDRAGSGEPRRASGSVPLVSWEAFRAVRAEPFRAGKVAGNLASGTVPLPRFVAFRFVRFTPEIAGSVAGNLASGMVPLRSVAGIVVVVLGLATPAATVCLRYPADKAPRFTSAVRLGFAVATTYRASAGAASVVIVCCVASTWRCHVWVIWPE